MLRIKFRVFTFVAVIMKSEVTHHHAHTRADYFGILGSVLCIVHCLVTPALMLGVTWFGEGLLKADLHKYDLLFVLINGLAVFYATRGHSIRWINLLLWGAWALFGISLLLEHDFPFFQYVSYFGSVLLIAGHSLNLYYCRYKKH